MPIGRYWSSRTRRSRQREKTLLPGVVKSVRSWSIGTKLALTLCAVVFLTALALLLVQHYLARSYLEREAHHSLRLYLSLALEALAVSDKDEGELPRVLSRLSSRLRKEGSAVEGLTIYAISQEGQLILPAGLKERHLPTQAHLLDMVRLGKGRLQVAVGDEEAWIYFQRSSGEGPVVVVQGLRRDLVGKDLARLWLWSCGVSLALALSFVVVGILLARREILAPLQKLTHEGERMMTGDLTPPEPLPGRNDELGRLSQVLTRLAETISRTLREAKESQERFHRLFTDSRDAAFIAGKRGRLIDVNPAAVAMFGFDNREEMLELPGDKAWFRYPAERRAYLRNLSRHGYVQDFPCTLQRHDGSSFEALLTTTAVEEGKIRFGLIRDVTILRRAERNLRESEARYRRLLQNAPDIIFRWSLRENRFQYLSPALKDILGFKPAELMKNPRLFFEAVESPWREQLYQAQERLASSQAQNFELEFRVRTKGGKIRWLRERAVLVRDHRGRPEAIEGLATDITESRRLQKELVQGRRMVEATLQGLPVAVLVIDRDHKVVHWNRAMTALTGVDGRERVGTDRQWDPFYDHKRPVLADLVLAGDQKGMQRYYADNNLKPSKLVKDGLEGEGFFADLGGRDRHLYFLAAPIRDEEGEVMMAVETLVDLSDKRRLEEELTRLSMTDELTGLYNQRFFYATLNREVEASRRYRHSLSLLMLDLDHFKIYNDTYGHLEGDRVLSACAELVRKTVRGTDLACRYGGEEFVVLLPYTGLKRALVVAERVRAGIESLEFFPVVPGKGLHKASITASIGVARLSRSWGPRELVRWADQAMYEAKHAGRNRVAICRNNENIEVIGAGAAS